MSDSRSIALRDAFVEETKAAIEQEHRRIMHCVHQLTEQQVWQRPTPEVNSVGVIIKHVCGNMGQWFLHGVGGAEDVRKRPAEFTDDTQPPKNDLLDQFGGLCEEVYAVLDGVDSETLLLTRTIQGVTQASLLAAIYATTMHLEGHALQISYITHGYLGEAYAPFWTPKTVEQGA